MTKDEFIAQHERAIGEYLDENPNATEEEAYDRTVDVAAIRTREAFAARIDHFRQLKKDGML